MLKKPVKKSTKKTPGQIKTQQTLLAVSGAILAKQKTIKKKIATKNTKKVKHRKPATFTDTIRLRYSVTEPNFSIVLPGGCNAKCGFCFAGAEKKALPINTYIKGLKETLDALPDVFTSVSITGGEPTLSRYFVPVLTLLAGMRDRFQKIVLTTNGTHLSKYIDNISGVVDHLNLSRHHHDDAENLRVFNNGTGKGFTVDSVDVRRIIEECSLHGIDVTANCVFDLKTHSGFFQQFTDWARNIGFSAIHFRKQNGNLKVPANWKKAFGNHKITGEGGCPVCKTTWIRVTGMRVALKTSVLEPDQVLEPNTCHELIHMADGVVYTDWAGTRKVSLVGNYVLTEILVTEDQKRDDDDEDDDEDEDEDYDTAIDPADEDEDNPVRVVRSRKKKTAKAKATSTSLVARYGVRGFNRTSTRSCPSSSGCGRSSGGGGGGGSSFGGGCGSSGGCR
jgi:organic radical activating enzyme/uncharacterized membrane protein YgcG